MTLLLQLLDLNSIGWALLHFLWQGALIGLVTSIVLGIIDRRSSHARYLVSCLSMFACLLVFMGTVFSFGGVENSAIQQGPTQLQIVGQDPVELGLDELLMLDSGRVAETSSPSLAVDDAESTSSWMGITINSVVSVMAIIWCIGIFVMGIRFARCWAMTQLLRRHGTSIPEQRWLELFDSVRKQLGVSRTLRLLQSTIAGTPMVIGWLKPAILIPTSVFTSLDAEEIRLIFMHELVHIRRRDHLVNIMQGIVEILLFFHPIIWWLSLQIRTEREHCCDDTAIKQGSEPRRLAAMLLKLESLRIEPTHASSVILTASGGSLMDRIKRLVDPSFSQDRVSLRWRTPLALAMGSVIAIGFVMNVGSEATAAETSMVMQDQDGLYSKKEVTTELRNGVASGELGQEDADRIMALWERFSMGVESGRMTSQQARERFDQRMEAMFKEGDRKEPAPNKDARSGRIGKLMIELGKAVDSGEMTPEQAVRRVMDMAERMKIGKGQPEMSEELQELKNNIQKRIDAMGEDLERKVKAGEITEEQAAERFKQGETRMWSRYRDAEEKQMKGRKEADAGNRELEELKARIEVQIKANGDELDAMVEAGKISKADAKARYEVLESRLWTRYRAAEMEGMEGDKRDSRDRMSNAEDADFEKKVADMIEMVKAGKMTREQMQQRLERMKMAMEGDEKSSGDQRRRRAEYAEAEKKMAEMVKAGKITREDMEKRLGEMRRAMGSRSDAGTPTKAEYAEAEKKMAGMVKAGKITRKDMETRLGEMRRAMTSTSKAGQASDDQRRRRADYAAAEAKMAEMVKAGKISREDMEKRLGEMKRAMAAEGKDEGKGRELPMPPEGSTPEEVREWFGRMKDRLGKAVESGRMSQEEADKMMRDIRMKMRGNDR